MTVNLLRATTSHVRVTFINPHHRYHQSIDRFGRLGEMKNDDTDIFLQSGLLCAAGSNSSIRALENSLAQRTNKCCSHVPDVFAGLVLRIRDAGQSRSRTCNWWGRQDFRSPPHHCGESRDHKSTLDAQNGGTSSRLMTKIKPYNVNCAAPWWPCFSTDRNNFEEFSRSIITTNIEVKNVTSRVLQSKYAPPPTGGHLFQRT
ncbi:hypothetical protein DPMN_177518 [Dreissena polymorpha]|uniref:Uncharacterized protein n=1 Tax=Dreissena polymorpha TaxID=45954 RepID=A0A9D4IK94_DREPO|nr:hypothetical protein DPMN_177518 [Dreissena polymorpha]